MKQRMNIQNEKQRECEWEWPKVRANVYHVIDSKVSTLITIPKVNANVCTLPKVRNESDSKPEG